MVTHFLNPEASPLNQLRREVDRLMTGFMGDWDPAALGVGRAMPPMNVWEQEDALMVEAELPGVKSDQIEVSVVGDELTLNVERPEPKCEGTACHRHERPEGGISRVLRLPVAVDAEKVQAKLVDGVLTITLPKAEAARPRKIAVKAG